MHDSWKSFLEKEFNKPYFKELSSFLTEAYQTRTIYPPKQKVFRAFSTDLNKITVVILGQDPYHTPGAAHGLAFSVPDGQPVPPSLINIFKEIDNDLGYARNDIQGTTNNQQRSGNLSRWQKQGVLLLNNTLTVEAHRAGSHRQHGWETFTEATIKYLNEVRPHLVFMLWGRDARNKAPLIDQTKHLILEAPHPSPLSAHTGFFGCKHFSKCNHWLKQHNLPEIEW